MRLRMLLAVAAATLISSSLFAQAPLQKPLQPSTVQLVRGGSGAPAYPVVVQGCGSCATGANCAKPHVAIGPGTINPVSCGCFASEKTFVFGSCRQFFNPQAVCGRGCTAGCRTGACDLPIYGPGIGVPANNCEGPFTYLFR